MFFSQISDTGCLKDSVDVDPQHLESLAAEAFERRISILEKENKELQRKYKGECCVDQTTMQKVKTDHCVGNRS